MLMRPFPFYAPGAKGTCISSVKGLAAVTQTGAERRPAAVWGAAHNSLEVNTQPAVEAMSPPPTLHPQPMAALDPAP